MSRFTISRRMHDLLVKHLDKIEEEKLYVIEKYYPVWTNERSDFQDLLNSYIKNIEHIINNDVNIDENAPDSCPFVIIGCKVVILDSYTNKTEEMHIVSPFKERPDFSVDNASYLSPMGRAFLLKKINDDVQVETPMGIFYYRVKAIELPNDVFQFY